MIRAFSAGILLLLLLCLLPSPLPAQTAGPGGSNVPRAASEGSGSAAAEEAHSAAPSYVLAFMGAVVVLLVVCVPSRKGWR